MPLNVALIVFELVVMVLSISLHDSAQAWMANRLGDPTGRMLGRISLNPARHFDPLGMIIWPGLFIYFTWMVLGWGKPVPMTYRNFRKKNSEMLAVLAGPAAQLLAATVALIVLVVLQAHHPRRSRLLDTAAALALRAPVDAPSSTIFPVLLLLYMCITVNLLLCVFNLIPMPFLDGGRILSYFLPYNAQKAFEQYSFYFMVAFFFFGFRLIMIGFMPLLVIFTGLLKAL